MYFKYGEKEICYLKSKDKKLAEIIDKIGYVERTVDTDLFSAVVHHIIGQQISNKALATIWNRLNEKLEKLTAETLNNLDVESLQSIGISFRKAEYIKDFARKVISNEFNNRRDRKRSRLLKDFARKVISNEFNISAVKEMSDSDAIKELTKLKGIGVWTAEMILLFCLQRQNIFSFDDLAIQRGLRMIYHHRKIDRKLFEKYKKRFTPYCSVASLYIWAVSGGAIPDMKDYAPKTKK